MGFLCGSDGKESTCNEGDLAWIPGMGRSPGGEHGNPLQYTHLENPHRQRSLAGYGPCCCKESDMTKRLSTAQHNAINRIILRTLLKNQLINHVVSKRYGASQVALVVKNPPANARDMRHGGFNLWVQNIPWKRAWQPTPIFLPEESHGQRNLVGYSPQGHNESDMTSDIECTHTHTHTHTYFKYVYSVITLAITG